MKGNAGKQMGRLYIKRYSSNSLEYTGDSFYSDNTKHNSISLFPKNIGKKENIELLDLQSQEKFHSARNSLKLFDINKIDESNINNSNKSLNSMTQPLLVDNFPKMEIMNSIPRYKVEKYDENCIEESKIEYIECLLEEQNKNFFFFYYQYLL